MISTFTLYSIACFATAFSGGLIPIVIPGMKENYLKLFVSLGAGLLLGMALVHMMPESSELLPNTFGRWFLVGFVMLLVLEKFVMIHACEEEGCDYHTIGMAAFVGLTVHGVIEGFALASSLIALKIGPMILFAILMHKAPAAFALTSILKLSGKTTKQMLLFILGIALSSPVGIVLAYTIMKNEAIPSAAAILLAISAGTFLYIAACDLIPELHRTDTEKLKRLGAFFVGVGTSFLSG